LTIDALAILPTHRPFLKAFTILLDAERFSTRAALTLFDAISFGWSSGPSSKGRFSVFMTSLVIAIHASTVLAALLASCKAFTVELHAFRIPAITYLLLHLF
jgi:hypothetical protein